MGSAAGSAAGGAVGASGSRASASTLRTRGYFTATAGLFGPELEDEDDTVLAKAINEVFGIRGEINMAAYQQVDDVDSPLYFPPQDYL